MKLKVFISECTDPYRNLAAEELLLGYVKADELLMYLWQNENTVVIGRNQNAWRECALEVLAAENGRLARRLSGGGAVFHDLGNQNFTFFARSGEYDVAKQSDVICHATRIFGIDAERTGRNDILADGRKFSGNAYYSKGSANYHHGTILLSSNLSKLGEFLTPSKEKLQSKGVESVRSRVVNLSELAPEITPEAMRKALVSSLEELYGGKVEFIDESVLDAAVWQKLTEHYGSREWTLGRLSDFDRQFHTRLSFGELELRLSVSNGVIKNAVLYSDALNAQWVQDVAERLCGCELASALIRDRLSSLTCDEAQTEEFSNYLASAISQ